MPPSDIDEVETDSGDQSTWDRARGHFRAFLKAYSQVLEDDDSRVHGGHNAEYFIDQVSEFAPELLHAASRLIHSQGVIYHKWFLVESLAQQFASRFQSSENLAYLSQIKISDRFSTAAEAAEHCYRLAIELDPEYGGPRFNLGSLLRESGNRPEAAEMFAAAAHLSPALSADADWQLAGILAEIGEDDRAEEAYRRAISAKPHFGAVHRKAADFFRHRGKMEDARTHYRIAATFHYGPEPELFFDPLAVDVPEEILPLGTGTEVDTTEDLLSSLLKQKGLR